MLNHFEGRYHYQERLATAIYQWLNLGQELGGRNWAYLELIKGFNMLCKFDLRDELYFPYGKSKKYDILKIK